MGEQSGMQGSVEAIEKAMRVLEALASAQEGLGLQALTQTTGIAKTTVHRLLATWIELGYVSRTASGGYALGFAVLELSRKIVRRSRVAEVGREVLRRLQHATGESVYLGVYRDGKVVLLDGLEAPHALRVVCDLGERCYLHASAQGRAVAAHLEEKALQRRLREQGLLPITSRTVTDRALVLRRIAEDRQRGYSINWEETVEGAVCLGVPFFAGTEGAVVGSLGLSIPLPRATEDHIALCLGEMKARALSLTEGLPDFPTEAEALPLAPVACASAGPLVPIAPDSFSRAPRRSSRNPIPPAS